MKSSIALKPRQKTQFARVLAKELPELLRKIEAYQGTPFTRFALQLTALTFVRTTEPIAARWEDFDLIRAGEPGHRPPAADARRRGAEAMSGASPAETWRDDESVA